MESRPNINKLGSDPHFVPGFAHTPFQDIIDGQHFTNLAGVDFFIAKGKHIGP